MPLIALSPTAMRPTPSVMQSMGAVQKPPAFQPRQPLGFWGRLGQAITPNNLMIAGQTLRDIATGGNSLPELLRYLDEERSRLDEQRWRRVQQDQAIRGWKRDEQQQSAVDDAISSLPANQQPIARAAPDVFLQQRVQQMFPEQPEWQAGYDHAYRINPDGTTTIGGEIPHAPRSGGYGSYGGAGGGPLASEGVQYYAQQYLRTGALPRGMSVRSPMAQQILAAVPRMAREANISPEQLALREAAYSGDRDSYRALVRQRDGIVAFERTADAFLNNVEGLLRAVPAGQISNVPSGNDALQAYYRTLGSSGPLSAYVGGLISARADLARVISGQTNPPVEAMHEAERLLPSNIAPSAFADVRANLLREMTLKSGAYDNTLRDIRERMRTGDVPQFDTGEGMSMGALLRRSVNDSLVRAPRQGGEVMRFDANGRRIP